MSTYHITPKTRPSKITIPEHAGPHVRLVFAEMKRQNVTYDDVEFGAGVLRATFKAWRTTNYPSLESLEAVMGFLGWSLVPVPTPGILPAELESELQRLAERFETSLPVVLGAMAEAVVQQRKRHGGRRSSASMLRTGIAAGPGHASAEITGRAA